MAWYGWGASWLWGISLWWTSRSFLEGLPGSQRALAEPVAARAEGPVLGAGPKGSEKQQALIAKFPWLAGHLEEDIANGLAKGSVLDKPMAKGPATGSESET